MKFILNEGKLYSYLDLGSFELKMSNKMAYYRRKGGTVVEYELQDGVLMIPEGVEALDQGVFPDNNHITELYLPNSVTRLDGGAFYNLDDVKKIHLPATIESIDVFDMRYLEQCMRLGCKGNFCAFGHCDEYATFYCEKGSFVDTYCN